MNQTINRRAQLAQLMNDATDFEFCWTVSHEVMLLADWQIKILLKEHKQGTRTADIIHDVVGIARNKECFVPRIRALADRMA